MSIKDYFIMLNVWVPQWDCLLLLVTFALLGCRLTHPNICLHNPHKHQNLWVSQSAMTDSAGLNSFIARALVLLCSNIVHGPIMSNTWLPAATWVNALTQSCQVINPALGSIDAWRFSTAMSKSTLFGGSMAHFDTAYKWKLYVSRSELKTPI